MMGATAGRLEKAGNRCQAQGDGSVLSGLLVIDKPSGLSSAQVVHRVKRSLGGVKVGHTGTLDPFASGVMLCCVGRATKLASFFLNGPKTYEATLRLGVETDTQDVTGRVTAVRDTAALSEAAVTRVMDRFRGEILQTPPVFSALKHEGTPLYKLARSGKPVTKPPRPVHIAALEIMRVALPVVEFRVACSAGTYIRTLGADIGLELGCGGHLTALRRLASCGFDISRALGLDQVADLAASGRIEEHLVPMADALGAMPCHVADHRLAAHIGHGKTLRGQDVPQPSSGEAEGYIKIVDTRNHLLAVLRAQGGTYQYCCVFPR